MRHRFTQEQVDNVRKIAHDSGECPTCYQDVSINTYGISPTMIETLKEISQITGIQMDTGGTRVVDVRVTKLDHNHRSSLTKLRLHGLLAKHKNSNGKHISGHWLVTTKGYQFLSGARVEAKVEVYDNTLLGHLGETTTKSEILKADKAANDADLVENKKITTAEAAAMSQLRGNEGKDKITDHTAEYKGSTNKALTKGDIVTISVSALKYGKPIYVAYYAADVGVVDFEYKDITAFMRDWKIQR